ncbi:hypothetical protein [Mixta intestinalis]|uniref:Uncharacterized protein n=1 Tax=Mixta intestinalis TaxID=1615494 RepID=A0A6P1PVB6_9GAMM|nr:hypothetical protein [Mixta intestinalis]QHM69937.1 hypothetical protein C7M51_00196 [Mixta intestinalis]
MANIENSNVARIFKDITKAARYIRENESEQYARINNNILEYLDGKEDFSYEYFVNDKVGYRIVNQTIATVLSIKVNEIYLAAEVFNKSPNLDNFNKLINCYYVEVLANIAAYFEGKELPARLDTNLSLVIMLCMAFFPIDEKKIIMMQLSRRLKNRIKDANKKNNPVYKICYGGHTVLPLSINLYNKFSGEENIVTDLSGLMDDKKNILSPIILENFNDLYRRTWLGFLSDDIGFVTSLFKELGDFHLERSKSNRKTFYEFDNTIWQYFPVEIICLLVIRQSCGKNVDFISHPVIDAFMPFIKDEKNYSLNTLSLKIRRELFKRNNYAMLFEL